MDTSGLQPVTLMSECFKDSPVVNLHCEKGPNMGMVEDFDIYQRPNDADLSDNSVTAENEGEERSPKLASKPGFNASSDKLVTNNNTEVSAVAEEIVQPANFSNCNGSITTESAAESISTYSRSCEQVDQLEDTDDFGDFADFTCGTEESPALPEEKNADRIEHRSQFIFLNVFLSILLRIF